MYGRRCGVGCMDLHRWLIFWLGRVGTLGRGWEVGTQLCKESMFK